MVLNTFCSKMPLSPHSLPDASQTPPEGFQRLPRGFSEASQMPPRCLPGASQMPSRCFKNSKTHQMPPKLARDPLGFLFSKKKMPNRKNLLNGTKNSLK